MGTVYPTKSAIFAALIFNDVMLIDTEMFSTDNLGI